MPMRLTSEFHALGWVGDETRQIWIAYKVHVPSACMVGGITNAFKPLED